MNTQQTIEAIKAATKQFYIGWPVYDTVTYIDADAFLAAVERLAEAENLANIAGVAKDVVWPKY